MNTQSFDLYDNNSYQRFTNKSEIEKDFQTLIGLIDGIQCDASINPREMLGLKKWVKEITPHARRHPYTTVLDVLNEALDDGILTSDEAENIKWHCKGFIEETGYFDLITSSIQKLHGFIEGIRIDENINDVELQELNAWLERNSFLKNSWPYDELYSIVTVILSDKIVTIEEHDLLMKFCTSISSKASSSNIELIETFNMGVCHIEPQIIIPEKTFCITGNSKKYKRRDIAEKIELFGGYAVSNVSSKLDYLIVCDEKNACWAFTCYGRKIEEAISHRKQGKTIVIAHEFDLYDALEDMR